MTRRSLFLPDALWDRLVRYATHLSAEEGRAVSAAEAVRRILVRALARIEV